MIKIFVTFLINTKSTTCELLLTRFPKVYIRTKAFWKVMFLDPPFLMKNWSKIWSKNCQKIIKNFVKNDKKIDQISCIFRPIWIPIYSRTKNGVFTDVNIYIHIYIYHHFYILIFSISPNSQTFIFIYFNFTNIHKHLQTHILKLVQSRKLRFLFLCLHFIFYSKKNYNIKIIF